MASRARPTRTPEWDGSAWSVLVLAEGGTPDQSYFQIGGAPSRAHVWTDPGCSLKERTSKLGTTMKYSVAIATWEKGASWRAQGWAGENGDRSDRTLHPSQVAAFDHPAFRRKDQMSRGIIKRRCSSRRALGSHLAHPEEGPTASLKGLLERIFGQCVSPSPPGKRALSSSINLQW